MLERFLKMGAYFYWVIIKANDETVINFKYKINKKISIEIG
jgi:hypothetical protein